MVDSKLNNTMSVVKDYLPIILEDLKSITTSKLDLVEGLLRYYDLLNHYENELKNEQEKSND